MKTQLLILALAVCMTANARVPEFGTPQRLAVSSGTDTKVAAFSPDGEYVLLTDGANRGLTRFDLATAKSTVLSTAPRAGYNVRISESSTRPQVRIEDRHMVLTLGDKQLMLAPNGEDKSYIWPSLSPDGRHLCYYVCADGCYVCDLNGSNVRRIARDCRAPQWLDNATIIGMNDVDDGEYLVSSELVAYTLQGERQVLTPSNMAALYPRCAGNKIVFSTAEGEIYHMTYVSANSNVVAEHVALPTIAESAACRPVPARKNTGSLPLSGKRFYLNPGHGSFGPNDRPMATIPYPNLPTTGMPDTCGFYESNTNLWKVLYLGQKLEAAGATVLYSRTQSGPWPYQKVNGDYPAYTTAGYKALPDYEAYNRALSEICEEVESNNINYFISVHSNATTDGSTANYPLYLYRGQDSKEQVTDSKAMGQATWKHRYEMMLSGIDPCNQSATFTNLRGDWDFYGSHKVGDTLSSGKAYDGYLGVLKHGAAGGLWEGYFHTYQPARHRALNQDYCHMEGLAYYRGILDYYNLPGEEVGYVLGTVKDLHNKMANNLFQYAPKTNDQWVPCNGATVTLKKGGVEVATYTVDSLYNGIFVFENLVPGTDYTLEASCGGYYDLADEYKAPFEVKANATTYPMIFLEDTSYTPPTIVYYNYPEPEQPVYLGLRSSFEMTQSYVDNTIDDLDGLTIRRVLYRDGKMYVLALDATKNPTLVEVDPATKQVLSTLPTDFCSVVASDGLKLSDITFTADGYLIGCNEERTTYDPVNKWKVYKWEHTDAGWTGALWFDNTNNETAGNYSNAITGTTIAYSGTLTDGYLAATAYTTGSNTHGTRFCVYTISDGAYAGAFRNKPAGITLAEYGHEVQMVVSPRDSMQFIFSSPNKEPFEWRMNTTTNSDITPVGTLPFHTNVANYFRYAKRSLMACPAEDDTKQNIGVALYDITDGLNKAKLIATTNTSLEASAATYTAAFGVVSGTDITLHLVADNLMSKFTTVGVEQAVVPAICAYDLNVTEESGVYTFSFVTNTPAKSAALCFYDAEGAELGSLPVAPLGGNLTEGAVSFDIPATQLPGKGVEMTWAVRLEGEAIADFGTLFSDKSLIASGTSRLKNTVNRNPESTKFGHIYIMHRAGSSSSALRTNSGIFDYDYSFTKLNDTRYNGGENFGNPQRLSMDNDDHLYIADWADDHSGVFVMNVQDLSQSATQLFAGTRNGAGVFTNDGVAVGSSTPSAQIYEPNDSTRWMLVYNEDASGTLPANGCAIYDLSATIGQDANPLIETAPMKTISLTGQANTEGNIQGTSHGFFVSQHRTSGNNNASATSLKFYDYEGNQLFSSASDEYKDIITGSEGGGYAIAADESWLIMNDGDKQFLLFDIEWEGNKPVLTLRYALKHASLNYRQMNLDYAGNLIASGDQSWDVFSLPSATNVTTVPARKSLTVQASAGVALESLTFAVASVDIELDKTMVVDTLLVFAPAEASNKMVTYSSFDASVATVDAKGEITAVKVGTTTIRATSLDGGFTADLTVNVKPVAVTGVEILSGTDGVMEINSGSNYALAFRVLPANAANTNTTWTSSDPDVVTCYEGTPGLIIGNQAGTSIITVTTEDGGFTATLTVYVDIQSDLPSVHQFTDSPIHQVTKYLRSGHLYIRKDSRLYNAQGARLE